jgi:moderate conductance mechanosensitive channel
MTGPLAELIARFTALEPSGALVAARLLVIVLTVVLLLLAYRVVVGLIQRLPLLRPGAEVVRVRTLASLLTSVARWTLGFVVVVVALRELGVDVGAIVVSAGILGIGIGLGAQSLIRDLITGMFLLFEDLIHVGDVVQIGSYTGTVESTGLRVATVRMDDGALRVVPNGQLTEFANYSLGGARAIVDVPVAREVPVARALAVLAEVGADWAGESTSSLDRPDAQGIIGWSGTDTLLRVTARVAPERRQATERDLRRRIKEAFDRHHWPPIGVPE